MIKKSLRAALRFYHAEHTLDALPVVTLPGKSAPRERWLTRSEVAALLRAALRNPRRRHVARFILIGYYTGTRSTALQKLRWIPSTEGGWFDLDEGRLYRKPLAKQQTKKRQTPAKIHARLLPHLRRWQKMDAAKGITHVIHFAGKRHSAATWLMQAGVSIWDATGYLGMSPETLERIYGHHHPDFQTDAAKALPPKAARPGPRLRVVKSGD